MAEDLFRVLCLKTRCNPEHSISIETTICTQNVQVEVSGIQNACIKLSLGVFILTGFFVIEMGDGVSICLIVFEERDNEHTSYPYSDQSLVW
jgi:hypothetical protein